MILRYVVMDDVVFELDNGVLSIKIDDGTEYSLTKTDVKEFFDAMTEMNQSLNKRKTKK